MINFDWDVLETTQPAVLGATLMNGTMIAESIVVVRPTQNLILFMGTDTEETPLERHLYSTTLNGKQKNRKKRRRIKMSRMSEELASMVGISGGCPRR